MNEKIENNFTHHPLKKGQLEKHVRLREMAKDFAYLIDEVCPQSREQSVAYTKLEEVVMWADNALVRN